MLTHKNMIRERFKDNMCVLPEVMHANESLKAAIIVDMIPNPTTRANRSKRKY